MSKLCKSKKKKIKKFHLPNQPETMTNWDKSWARTSWKHVNCVKFYDGRFIVPTLWSIYLVCAALCLTSANSSVPFRHRVNVCMVSSKKLYWLQWHPASDCINLSVWQVGILCNRSRSKPIRFHIIPFPQSELIYASLFWEWNSKPPKFKFNLYSTRCWKLQVFSEVFLQCLTDFAEYVGTS